MYLIAASLWSAVPAKVADYTRGGYQVKKSPSYRELPLLGRFSQVVRRIAAILLMGPASDASYAAILPTATGLPPHHPLPIPPPNPGLDIPANQLSY
jgi:hypothetical protein